MNAGRSPQVSLLRCRVFRSFRLQPPLTPAGAALGVESPALARMVGTSRHLSHEIAGAIGLRHFLAGSSRSQAESSSLALRTNRSPRVAPHPASRRRSYLRVRKAKPPLDGDFHPANSYTITGALVGTLRVPWSSRRHTECAYYIGRYDLSRPLDSPFRDDVAQPAVGDVL